MESKGRQPLRADSERTVRTILEAAEQVLSKDPGATMAQVAAAAGVARTTVHRRFASREALVDALARWAAEKLHQAVLSARPESAPTLVALHQATSNVLQVKIGWRFAMAGAEDADPEVTRIHAEVRDACRALFTRACGEGLLPPDADVEWARRVYYALLHEVIADTPPGACDAATADRLAARVVDTFLHGVGAVRA